MKRFSAFLLALTLLLSLYCPMTALAAPAEAPVAVEVRGVTVPPFTVSVNGIPVTHDEMAAYPTYSVQATSVNSAGTESNVTYVGFAIRDVLAAAGLNDAYVWLEASADDGYAVTITGDEIALDTTLLAISRDGAAFAAAPWFAPCTSTVTGSYLKGAVAILVNTVEGAPDIAAPAAVAAPAEAPAEVALPEILDRTDKVEFAPFSFKVNGADVTNEVLAGLSIFKIDAVNIKNNGESSVSGYTGYKLLDVLAAVGAPDATSVKAVANDGYETQLDGALIASDYTLVAIEKDKETGEGGTVWLAPCSETSAKSYCKLVVELITE